MRHSRRKNGAQIDPIQVGEPESAEASVLPFALRLTCTIAEACEASGLGRTKLYELIGDGRLLTTTVGRRRLVIIQSLVTLLDLPRKAG